MKVRDLINLLEDHDPDAEVLFMTQPSWPFECSIAGVTSRDEVAEEEGDEPRDEERDGGANDVFLLEGRQVRYGSKRAWR